MEAGEGVGCRVSAGGRGLARPVLVMLRHEDLPCVADAVGLKRGWFPGAR